MKNFKKIVILAISLCIIFSLIMTSPIYASTDDSANTTRPNITDVIPADIETYTIYFYKPDDWGDRVGIYWYEGSYSCELEENKVDGKGWPGYEVTQTEESDKNIYVAKVPKDARQVQFNNLIYGEGQCYTQGIVSYVGNSKIYVANGNPGGIVNETPTVSGDLFYYYGDGKYGTHKTLEEAQANDAVYSNGECPLIDDKNYIYEYVDRFLEWSKEKYGIELLPYYYYYGELYSHNDNDGNKEWVFVEATYFKFQEYDVKISMTIGNRYIYTFLHNPFKCGYGIYDVKENTFYDLYNLQDNPERFNGLVDALNEMNIGKVVENPTQPSETVAPTTEPTQPTTSATEPTEPTESKTKKTNKMTVTVKDKKVKVKKLKSAKVTVKAITVKKANGAVSFKKVAKKSSDRLTVNKKGNIIVKKGTKKGNYKIKVKITAKGTKNYESKTVTKTVKIKVR